MEEQPTPTKLQPGQGCALFGLALAAMAIFVFPLGFGPAGMVLGAISFVRGERRGRWVIALAALGMVLGLLLGMLPDKFVSN